MKIFPEIEMEDVHLPDGTHRIAMQTKVRATRKEGIFEEEFKGLYPAPNTAKEMADIVGHFMLECYGWQQCYIFTTEQPALDTTPEDKRVWDIFNISHRHKRDG